MSDDLTFDEAMAVMTDKGIVTVGGRSAIDEDQLRFIFLSRPSISPAVCEPIAGTSSAATADADSAALAEPDSKEPIIYMTPSGMDAMTVDLSPLLKAQLVEVAETLGVDAIPDLKADIAVAVLTKRLEIQGA